MIPRLKTLHHPEYHLTKRLGSQKNFNAKKACLSKYFPKYYRNLDIELPAGDWTSQKRLGQTKIIENFTCDIDDKAHTVNKLEQKIFRTKRKSVRSFPLFYGSRLRRNYSGYGTPQPERPQFSTLYPNLILLNISSIKKLNQIRMDQLFLSRELEQEIKRSYGYFWNSMRHVERLELSDGNFNFWFMIQQVNSSPRFLSSLKTLKLSLAFRPSLKNNLSARDLLGQLVKNEHLLNHVTHLNCSDFETLHHFDYLMGSILAQCSRLVYLNIPIGREALYWVDLKEIFPEHKGTQVFEQIQKLNKLKTLNVSAFGTEGFARYFSPPSSIQSLDLYVGKSLKDKSWLDSFCDPEYNFFERWRDLPNLKTFKLKMCMINEPDDLFKKFINPLLEAISSKGNVKELRLEITEAPIYCRISKNAVVNFSLLLNEKSFVFPQLESLEILSTSEFSFMFDPKDCPHLLSPLKNLTLHGHRIEQFDPKAIIRAFSASQDQSQRLLKLPAVEFKSIGAFKDFLKFANKTVAGSGDLELHLNLTIWVKDLEKLFDHFEEQSIYLERNCIVTLNIHLEKAASWKDRLNELSRKETRKVHKIFGNFFKLEVGQDENKTLLKRSENLLIRDKR